jgi:GT2 family glycosyltransferase
VTREAPDVSVVIVAFGGGWAWLPRALDALRRNTTARYEVILVDNGGVDEPVRVEERDLEVLLNATNVGFGTGSNQGASRARSDVLVFLNPDTLVEPGWLAPLLERANEGGVGAVFPAKLNLDGTMQEAGAFVTGQAHAYVFGDRDAADDPAHAFRREIDFGSAAAMCITRQRFDALSGFDPAYRLAYYEDADLCFRLRDSGLRSVYEPEARVRHARSVSAPPAELVGVYTANREVFVKRWGDAVAGRPTYDELSADPSARLAARDLHAHRRVLVVGGANWLEAAAEALARAHPRARITFLADHVAVARQRELLAAGVEVPAAPNLREWLVGRLDHYTHVLMPRPDAGSRTEAVRETQRRAELMTDADKLHAALTT